MTRYCITSRRDIVILNGPNARIRRTGSQYNVRNAQYYSSVYASGITEVVLVVGGSVVGSAGRDGLVCRLVHLGFGPSRSKKTRVDRVKHK